MRLITRIGRLFGIGFAPDNHVAPIVRFERYRRVAGPGHFLFWPFLERPLESVNVGLRVGNFAFQDVLSKDNIPFVFQMTILYKFDPGDTQPEIAAQLVRAPVDLLHLIVKDYASQGLRRLASTFKSDEIPHAFARAVIERDLSRFLIGQLAVLGISPLKEGGLLVKEIVPPEKFKQSMVNVRGLEATMRELVAYRSPALMEWGTLATFLTNLVDRQGEILFMPPLSLHQSTGQTSPTYSRMYQNGH
jgi:hypothetical protein